MADKQDMVYPQAVGTRWEHIIDPVTARPATQCAKSHCIAAELMKWVCENAAHGDTQFFSNIGCDIDYITRLMAVAAASDRVDTPALLDYLIVVTGYGSPHKPDSTYACWVTGVEKPWGVERDVCACLGCRERDDETRFIVCRETTRAGHGCQWFEITRSQAERIVEAWKP
jgi:hypothetical protein